jgi:hypothetical protein
LAFVAIAFLALEAINAISSLTLLRFSALNNYNNGIADINTKLREVNVLSSFSPTLKLSLFQVEKTLARELAAKVADIIEDVKFIQA